VNDRTKDIGRTAATAADRTGRPNPGRVGRGVVLLGPLTTLLVLAYGLLLDAPGLPALWLPVLPAVGAAVWAGALPARARTPLTFAVAPVAVAVVVAVLLVGTTTLDTAAWWVAGALVAAVPFVAGARLFTAGAR
jgi:hypothetical protein